MSSASNIQKMTDTATKVKRANDAYVAISQDLLDKVWDQGVRLGGRGEVLAIVQFCLTHILAHPLLDQARDGGSHYDDSGSDV